ncbi:MAG: PPC domain-containing protein [Gemmatimonadaceae bacterium]|nr:PPC domain-containing protein [Gemmatimonadaceae bacterium]MCW5826071.1 PPC domain-containing protein [Gemmatimonadaceae bacterium]
MPATPRVLIASAAVALAVTACADEVAGPRLVELVANQSVTVSGRTGSERLFRLEVPEGAGTLRVRLTEGAGDPDLIMRYGARPEPGLVTCLSESDGPEEECLIDAPTAGNWYILVYGYTAYDDVRLIPQILAQTGATPVTSGVPVSGLSGGQGDFRMFSIDVPPGVQNLTVTLDAVGDADLYVRRSTFPLLNQYDCASFTVGGDELCSIAAPQAGTWYLRIEGFEPYSGATLTATLTMPDPEP